MGNERLLPAENNGVIVAAGSATDNFITLRSIPSGDFDNVAKCRYAVPGYWDIGTAK